MQTTTSVQQGVSLKTRSNTIRFTLHSSISVTSSWLCFSCALKSSQTRNNKFSPENKQDSGMAYHIPPLKKVQKTRGNAITQPRSHLIPKFDILLKGWDWGWVMAFLLVSLLFWGVEYDRPSLNPFCFLEKIFCFLSVSFLERMTCVVSLR